MPRNCQRSKAAVVRLYDAAVKRALRKYRASPWLCVAEDRHRASVERYTSEVTASGRPERVAQVRTRRTAPLDQSVADPSSLPASRLRDRMNQRTPCASTGEFFNTIRQIRTLARLFDQLVGAQQDRRWHFETKRLRGLKVDDKFDAERGALPHQECYWTTSRR